MKPTKRRGRAQLQAVIDSLTLTAIGNQARAAGLRGDVLMSAALSEVATVPALSRWLRKVVRA